MAEHMERNTDEERTIQEKVSTKQPKTRRTALAVGIAGTAAAGVNLWSCSGSGSDGAGPVSDSQTSTASAEDYLTAGIDLPDEICFNEHVRPILNKNCTACHGGVEKAGGVSFLFREEAIIKGKFGKWAIKPGKPEQSHILDRILDVEDPMPPEDHGHMLDKKQTAILSKWIKQGAPWDDHWAYVEPSEQKVPSSENDAWSQGVIDRFLFEKMKEMGLSPNPDGKKQEVMRKMSLDLTGIPPSLEMYQEYADRPYAEFVDSLLDSKHYGERWAGMWMDLARYADSMGYERDPNRAMWPYRDWLVRSFNEDKPYDEFVIEQLAGDLLDKPTMDQMIATAFVRQSQSNTEGGTDDEEFRVASVMERVNTTWDALLAVSYSCVQCHTHPYDPFKHEEYFAFKGFFENAADNDDRQDYPKLLIPNKRVDFAKARELQIKLGELEAERASISIDKHEATAWSDVKVLNTQTTGTGSIDPDAKHEGFLKVNGTVPYNAKYTVDFEPSEEKVSAIKVNVRPDQAGRPSSGYVIKMAEVFLVDPSGKAVPVKLSSAYSDFQRAGVPLNNVLSNNNSGWWNSSKIFQDHWLVLTPEQSIHVPKGSKLRISLSHLRAYELKVVIDRFKLQTSSKPSWIGFHHSKGVSKVLEQLAQGRSDLSKIQGVQMPVMQQHPKVDERENNMFIRGNWLDRGEVVKPGVPATLNELHVRAKNKGEAEGEADRLDMARWLVNEKNPLAARVIVNRIWSELFGIGIVRSLGDFGTQGDKPTHPELLDYLAMKLMHEYDWRLKPLIRDIVLSRAYQLAPKVDDEAYAVDPFNQYAARGSRARLPAEMIRDQALFVSGLLSEKQFGPPVKPYQPPGIWAGIGGGKWEMSRGEDRLRRAIYTHWRRTRPYPSAIVFDAPTREICNVQRHVTNTPLHALVTLNDPVFAEAAEALAERAVSGRKRKDSTPSILASAKVGGVAKVQEVSIKADVKGVKELELRVGDAADGIGHAHANWINPRLIGPKGTLELTKLKWQHATAGYGKVQVGKNAINEPIRLKGKTVANSIGTHALSEIVYAIPEGYHTFEVTGALASSATGKGSVEFQVLSQKALSADPFNEVNRETVVRLYRYALGTEPEAEIADELLKLYKDLLGDISAGDSVDPRKRKEALTGVASAVLNLDEFLTK